MNVLVTYESPTDLVLGHGDSMLMDLVAHFLGIATHHNDNTAPSTIAPLKLTYIAKDL
jgi:hypothetical protein